MAFLDALDSPEMAREVLRLTHRVARTGWYVLDQTTGHLSISAEMAAMLGVGNRPLEMSVDDFRRRFHPPERLDAVAAPRDIGYAIGDDLSPDTPIVCADGSRMLVRTSSTQVAGADGAPMTLGLLQDITDLRKAELQVREHTEALQRSEERFRVLSEQALAGVYLLQDGRIVYANPALERMAGAARGGLLGRNPVELVHPDDRATIAAGVAARLQGDLRPRHYEVRVVRPDGTITYMEILGSGVEFGGRAAVVGTVFDMTSRHEFEEQLRRSGERIENLNRVYAMLSATAEMLVRERDAHRLLERACEIAVEKGGFRMAWIGMIDSSTRRLVPTASAGRVEGYLDLVDIDLDDPVLGGGPSGRCARSGIHVTSTHLATDPTMPRWRAAAVERGYASAGAFPLTVDGRVAGVFTLYSSRSSAFDEHEQALLDNLARDIGFGLEVNRNERARVEAEAALIRSELRFREIAENIDQVFWAVNPIERQTLYVSPAFERIWARPRGEPFLSLEDWIEFVHLEDRDRVMTAIDTGLRAGDYDEEYRIVRPDGTLRWIHDRAFPVRDSGGAVYRVVGVASDITERRALEAQLRQSQKMEAIGRFAGGIAHDFNNMLAAIVMEADLAVLADVPTETRELMADIKAAAQRAASLTRQLLAFSRQQVMQRREVDLNVLVDDLSKMLSRIVGEDVHVDVHLHAHALMIHADPQMVDQVLMNLAINGRDAMPEGGTLTIETSPVVIDELRARAIGVSPGPYASLQVSDSGVGISADVLPHIFEPFFTTKESDKGTGLGLATVFGIARQHDGGVTVRSTPGEGTMFEVLFPVAA